MKIFLFFRFVATPCLFACTLVLSNIAASQPTKGGVEKNEAFAACQKKYREAEINNSLPHSRGTMQEICLNVEESCVPANVAERDCIRAKASVNSLIDGSLAARTSRKKR
jgi:hypothetical protein